MVSINYSTREVTCKIVYYGPGLSGKTTNLLYIHEKVPNETKGKMISLATEADRTLYFDFLPINIGTISGFAAKFQLYTVPGQVYYNATRKLVLRGADGLVFVADSQADKMDENIESLNNLKENLAEYGYDIDEIPVCIQYNKRDLPNVLSVEELESKLNPKGWKSFEAVAVNGSGVFDTLKMIIKLVLDKARKSEAKTGTPNSVVSPAEPAAKPTREPVSGHNSAAMPAAEEKKTQTPIVSAPSPDRADKSSAAFQEPSPVREPAYEEPLNKPAGNMIGEAEKPRIEDSSSGESQSFDSRPNGDNVAETPAEDHWGAQRPYPGSTGSVARQGRRLSVSDFQTASQEVEYEQSGTPAKEKTNINGVDSYMPKPTMAPSNRVIKKKRGFFKRLFGK